MLDKRNSVKVKKYADGWFDVEELIHLFWALSLSEELCTVDVINYVLKFGIL